MGLLPLLGSPLPAEAAFLRCVRRQRRRAAPANADRRPPTAQAAAMRLCWLSTEEVPVRVRRLPFARESCAVESSWTRRLRVVVAFFGCQFHLLVCAKPIAAGSVCADREAVVAATRRICAALRREARIAINSAHGSSTTKAIIAAPPLSGRTGDGASRRDSRKSLHCSAKQWPSRSARTINN